MEEVIYRRVKVVFVYILEENKSFDGIIRETKEQCPDYGVYLYLKCLGTFTESFYSY